MAINFKRRTFNSYDELKKTLSEMYCKYMLSINWEDHEFVYLQSLMINKFLTLTYYHLLGGKSPKTSSQFVSPDALELLNSEVPLKGFVLEHIIPKQHYIQKTVREWAEKGSLQQNDPRVLKLIQDNFHVATLIAAEDKLLKGKLSKKMPREVWTSIYERYDEVGIKVIANPYFPFFNSNS